MLPCPRTRHCPGLRSRRKATVKALKPTTPLTHAPKGRGLTIPFSEMVSPGAFPATLASPGDPITTPQPPNLWSGLCRRPRQPHAAQELSHCSGGSRLPSGASREVLSQRAFHVNTDPPKFPWGVGVTADPQRRAHSQRGRTSTADSRASQPASLQTLLC